MSRLVIACLAYIFLFLGFLLSYLAVITVASYRDSFSFLCFLGGMAIVSFVVSWLLLEISRKK